MPLDLTLPRVHDAAITLDGRADEAAWAQALVLPDTTPYEPTDDVTPVGSMVTRIVCDDASLYVHFDVTDPEPDLVRAGLGRRDTRWDDDMVGVLVDPKDDGRRGLMLAANAIGVQVDQLHISGSWDDDDSWDAVWRSAGHRTATGYEVELAIPWSAVSVRGDVPHIGLMLIRSVARKDQLYAWPKVEPGTELLLSEAHLAGPGHLPKRVGLEIMPELTGAWSNPHVESGRLEAFGLGPGLTLHYNPTSGFGAAGTFNPDFSQLESDAAQIDVNQRYALSYDEKRPFFLEGQDWFDHPMWGLVYTRSMNAPLYGARATAEAGPLGVAALHTMDMAPPPSVSEGGGWTPDQLDGHPALATLARARLGLGGDSYLGLLASDRTVTGTELYNRLLGIDTTIRLEKRATLAATALGSATTFGAAKPTLAPAGMLDFKWSGENLFLHTNAEVIAPGFRQENGFVTQEDIAGILTEDHARIHPGLEWLPLLAIEPVDVWTYSTLDGTPRDRGWDPSVWGVFGDGSMAKLDFRMAGESFAGTWIDYRNAELYVETSAGSWLRLEAEGGVGTRPYYDPANPRAGNYQSGEAGIAFQPVPRFTLSLLPGVEHMTDHDGTPLYLAWTGRARAELFFDRATWVRVVAQLDDEGDGADWRIEPVGGWEWTPGRAAYLGGAYGVEAGAPTWQVFAKVGWVFAV